MRFSLETSGFPCPDGVDAEAHNKINQAVARRIGANPTPWHAFAGAWMAIPYRIAAAKEYADRFATSISASTAPPPPGRYRQDHDLFGFAVSAASALECFYFALNVIGHSLDSVAFPLAAPSDLRFYPRDVADRFQAAFPSAPLTSLLAATLAAPEQDILFKLRNVLSHRGTPARQILLASGAPDIPARIPSNMHDLAASWRYDWSLEPSLVNDLYHWVTNALLELHRTAMAFVTSHIGSP